MDRIRNRTGAGPTATGDLPAGVLKVLHAEIASGRWPRGSRIPTWNELAAELRVGRSTIREAVSTLVHLGMLLPQRGRGTVVSARSAVSGVLTTFSDQYDVEELFVVQRSLEVEVCRLAALRRTDADLVALAEAGKAGGLRDCRHPVSGRFHAVLLEIARTPLLTDLSEGIEARLRASGSIIPSRTGGLNAVIDQHHRAILAAVGAGDGAAAAAAADAHSRATCQHHSTLAGVRARTGG